MPEKISIESLCNEIMEKRNSKYATNIKPYPRSQPISSDLGDCIRETVLAITNWQDKPEFSVELIQRFERGNKIEDMALAELQSLGYKVRVERKPFEIKDKKGRVILRGRLDGFLEIERQEYPFECKSLNPNVFKQIDIQEDFDRYPFFRKYPRQLQSYLLAQNLEQGFWLIDNCLGAWKLIPCRLDYERAEQILQQAEMAIEHIANGTLPDYHYDPSYCLRCWARARICNPPFFAQGEGLKIINDPEFSDKLKRRAELDPMASEYDRLDKEIKEALKTAMKPGDNWIIGDYLVTAEQKTRKSYTVKASEYTQFKIEPVLEDVAIAKSNQDYTED